MLLFSKVSNSQLKVYFVVSQWLVDKSYSVIIDLILSNSHVKEPEAIWDSASSVLL